MKKRDQVRAKDSERKRKESEDRREVVIPPCANPELRKQLEAEPHKWLRHYLGHIFTYEFTEQQTVMIDALVSSFLYGGDQAVAASRGEGKTTTCECVLLWAILAGVVKFAVLFSATGTDAENSLATWKALFVDDEATQLKADYPEVVYPILALENTPNRAHYQIVSGKRHDNGEPYKKASSKFSWTGRKVTLPKVPGSPSSGAIMATRGLDGAVRGVKHGSQRPDVAVIDDPDTEETVNSEDQAKKLRKKIDRTIAGLGGQKRRISRVMLTTIQKRGTVSDEYTDAKKKPAWKGRRFRFLVTPPERMDLWEEYFQLRNEAMESFAAGAGTDEHARNAHNFYIENHEAMNIGAKVANKNRFDETPLPDGSQVEIDALQCYMNLVADNGQDNVSTEYDNDPPEESGPQESGITAYRIQTQVNGYEHKVVPPGCVTLVQAIDCRKVALHYVVRGFHVDGTGFTIDKGVHEVYGTRYGTDEGVDQAIKRAILDRMEHCDENPYCDIDGNEVTLRLTLVDAGYRTDAVYAACVEYGLGLFPAMGAGKSNGCVKTSFSDQQRQTKDKKVGDGWFFSRRAAVARNLWLVMMDTDRWKAWEHDRWMTDLDKTGSMSLWGEPTETGRLTPDQKSHFTYAKHLTAEIEIEDINKKGVLERKWHTKSNNNHFFDASYMCDVAASITGVRLNKHIERQEQRKQQPKAPQPAQRPDNIGARRGTMNAGGRRARW